MLSLFSFVPLLVFPGVLPFSQMASSVSHLLAFASGALPCHLGPLHMCTFIALSHFSAFVLLWSLLDGHLSGGHFV